MATMPTWILLRGLARESAHWGALPALLREQLGGATVIALDLPGNGRLHAQASPTRIDAMTQWCRAEVARRGLAPPYRLLAISMGAMVAIDWARTDPAAIGGCVLINTSLRPFDPWWRRLRPANYAALLRLAWPGVSAAAHERAILRLTSRNRAASDRVLDEWTRLRRERPVTGRNALRQLLAAARFRAAAEAPAVPLLVLASRRDGLVDARCSLQLAQRWRAALAVHEQAGHDLPLDDGAWVAQQVARWVAQCGARP
jgi:pimeloyl-ACP methyl ester carboxylesterase